MLEQKEIDPEIINRAIAATVRVDCKSPDYPRDLTGFEFLSFSLERIGTGVHLGNGRVITARHVLSGLKKPGIYVSGNQRRWVGEIAGLSEDLDIGIIQIDPSADLGLVE
ncbi:hypothetical protein HYZ06_00045 [Candidatus Daviesbacteria bacterium]|nr:hypothetical protein [Candidatus Daviesbacteria bacterium]MBI3109420.1 hypothetical protein [Candidatus Daviesbacteria bacterium]